MPPKQKAQEKQELLEAERTRKALEDAERKEAAEWSVGAKTGGRAQEMEEKDAVKRQKAAEKAALLAADEEALSSVVKVGKPAKKKGKDDFDMLNAALANQPKTKAQKDAEAKKKATEELKRKEAETREEKEAKRKVMLRHMTMQL